MATTLVGANQTPAQTWNWLKTNDCELTVPTSCAADPQADVPAAARRVVCGAGCETTQWLDASAAKRRCIEVAADEPGKTIEIPLDTQLGTVEQTTIFARPNSEVNIVVIAAEGLGCETKTFEEREYVAENEAVVATHKDTTSHDDAPLTSGHVLRICAEAYSRVIVSVLVAASDSQQYLDSLGITADDGAEVVVRQYVLGAGICSLGTQVDLKGNNTNLDLTLHYLGTNHNKLDFGYNVPVSGRYTRCDLAMTGVLTDTAEKALRTMIDFKHGCKGSKGSENETVLVAGDGVINKTLPTILCDEDDVEGNHGATIGSVSPEQLSYLYDRGLTEDEVASLFRRAIIDDAVTTLTGSAPQAVIRWAEGALDAETAADIADSYNLNTATTTQASIFDDTPENASTCKEA